MFTTPRGRTGRTALAVALALVLFAAPGCSTGGDIPKTYPATGTVRYEDGKPLPGGAIQFTSLTDSSLTISGKIDKDGSFSLRTIHGNATEPGAPEGKYRVTIIPSATSDRRAVRPHTLPETQRVEAHENTYTFKLPRAEQAE
jgi:hypothetical protein